MVCPTCGQSTNAAGACSLCGTGGETSLATDVLALDTTGLPPGATRAPGITATDGATGTGTSPVPVHAGGRSTGPLHVGQSFSPRYHIIKLLGAGGMRAVCHAWDAELSVPGALRG